MTERPTQKKETRIGGENSDPIFLPFKQHDYISREDEQK